MPNIHYYDTDTGYIHYVSEVIPKLECRVADAVRSFDDAMIAPVEAVQFIPNFHGDDKSEQIRRHIRELVREAVTVSNKGVLFMDRIMNNSPLRDSDGWKKRPEGRALFLSQRRQRQQRWRDRRPL